MTFWARWCCIARCILNILCCIISLECLFSKDLTFHLPGLLGLMFCSTVCGTDITYSLGYSTMAADHMFCKLFSVIAHLYFSSCHQWPPSSSALPFILTLSPCSDWQASWMYYERLPAASLLSGHLLKPQCQCLCAKARPPSNPIFSPSCPPSSPNKPLIVTRACMLAHCTCPE